MKTITTWKNNQQFESKQDSHSIHVDGNKQNGMSPKALLLSAVAACSGIDIVEILQKMKLEFSNFIIEVEADQTEEHPRVFKDINVLYTISTDTKNEQKIRRAIDLSLDKYCGVSAMLKKNSQINYELRILE